MQIPNLKEIVVAWIRARNPTEAQQRRADVRMAICEPCDQKVFSDFKKTYVCDACGCPLAKKIFSPLGAEACPKGKWTE